MDSFSLLKQGPDVYLPCLANGHSISYGLWRFILYKVLNNLWFRQILYPLTQPLIYDGLCMLILNEVFVDNWSWNCSVDATYISHFPHLWYLGIPINYEFYLARSISNPCLHHLRCTADMHQWWCWISKSPWYLWWVRRSGALIYLSKSH